VLLLLFLFVEKLEELTTSCCSFDYKLLQLSMFDACVSLDAVMMMMLFVLLLF
jgi:hypothetical protein